MPAKRKQRKSDSTEPPRSFETALGRLEEIAEQLETGDVALEEAIALAEEGGKLSQFCEQQLTVAAGKIERLVDRMGVAKTEPLTTGDEDTEDEEA